MAKTKDKQEPDKQQPDTRTQRGPETVTLVVQLDGVQYEENEGRQLIESILERNNVNYKSVRLAGKKKSE